PSYNRIGYTRSKGSAPVSRFTRPAAYAVAAVIVTSFFSYAWTSEPGASSSARPVGTNVDARPQEVPASRIPIHYTVQPNDTLDSVAARFNVNAEQIRWSNPRELTSTDQVEAGQTLVIPPVSGVVVRLHPG